MNVKTIPWHRYFSYENEDKKFKDVFIPDCTMCYKYPLSEECHLFGVYIIGDAERNTKKHEGHSVYNFAQYYISYYGEPWLHADQFIIKTILNDLRLPLKREVEKIKLIDALS